MDNKFITEAVKAAGLLSHAKVVWVRHPLLSQVAQDFANYVGDKTIAENGKPLINVAIKAALQKYEQAGGADEREKATMAFLTSILTSSIEVFAQQLTVKVKNGEYAWSPFTGSAVDFLNAYPDAEVNIERKEMSVLDSLALVFMMTKILPSSLLEKEQMTELLAQFKVEV